MKKIVIGFVLFATLLYGAWQGLNLFDDRFKYGRMWETHAIRPHESVLPVMEPGSVPISKGEAGFKALEDDLLVSPYTGNEARYAPEGMDLYLTYCAQCHGRYLDGKGTVGQSFSPLPSNLRSRYVQAMSDGLMFKRISYGNPPNGRQPPLSTTVSVIDRWKIIAYIRTSATREASAHDSF